jgi:hypothetical protein
MYVEWNTHKDVKGGMKCEGVHTTQVSMIMPDHFVVLQIPTLHHLVLTSGEEVGVSWRYCEASHCIDMSSKCEFQSALCTRTALSQVPHLDSSIRRPSHKPLIRCIEGD